METNHLWIQNIHSLKSIEEIIQATRYEIRACKAEADYPNLLVAEEELVLLLARREHLKSKYPESVRSHKAKKK